MRNLTHMISFCILPAESHPGMGHSPSRKGYLDLSFCGVLGDLGDIGYFADPRAEWEDLLVASESDSLELDDLPLRARLVAKIRRSNI